MVAEDLYFDGEKYLSVRSASKITKYAADYIGQLCRAGKLRARRVGRGWYIEEKSLAEHLAAYSALSKNHEFRNQGNAPVAPEIASDVARELMRREIDARVSEEIKSLSKPVIESVPSPVLPELKKKPEEKKEPLVTRSATPGGFSLAERKESNKEKSNEVIKKSERGFKRNEENSLHSLIPSFLPSPNKLAALALSVAIVFFGYQLEVNQVHLADVARLPVPVVTEISKSIQDMRSAEMRALSLASAGDGIVEIIRRAGEKIADRLFGDFGYTLVVTAPDEEKNQALLSEIEGLKKRLASFERAGGTLASGGSAPAVIERVVSVVSGVSETDLNVLENSLKSELYRVAAVSASANNATYQAVALTNRIDALFNTAISGATITGSTFAGSVAATSLSASGDGSVGGALTVTGTITSSSGTTTVQRLSIAGLDCSALTNAGKLTVDATGGVVCQDDLGGGASASDFTYSSVEPDLSFGLVRMATTSNQLVLGGTSTSSSAKLEVIGNQYISGNLGIGTTTPTKLLSVGGQSFFDGDVFIHSSATPNGTGIFGSTTNSALNTQGLVFETASFAGVDDPALFLGYGRKNPVASQPRFYLGIEGNYDDGSRVWSEAYFEKVDSNGTIYRPWALGTYNGYADLNQYVDQYSVRTSPSAATQGVALYIDTPSNRTAIGTTTLKSALTVADNNSWDLGAGSIFVSDRGTIGAGLTLNSTGTDGRSYSIISTQGSAGAGVGKLAFLDGTASAYRMVLDSKGQLGIGIDTPLAALDVASTSSSGYENAIKITATKSDPFGTGMGLVFYSSVGDNIATYNSGRIVSAFDAASGYNNGRLTFQTPTGAGTFTDVMSLKNGSVGIGTTTPSFGAGLTVTSNPVASPYSGIHLASGVSGATGFTSYSLGRTGIDGYWGLAAANDNYMIGTVAGDTVLMNVGGKLHFGTGAIGSASNAMTVSSGNVGIGTTDPGDPLEVLRSQGTDTMLTVSNQFASGNASAFFQASVAGATGYFGSVASTHAYPALADAVAVVAGTDASGGIVLSARAAASIKFLTNAGATDLNERMRIDSNGNVGIGTTTPNNKLDIYSTTKSAIGFSGADGSAYKWTIGMDVTNGGRFSIASSTALGTTDRLVINGGGNVGIGVSAPTAKLTIGSGNLAFDSQGSLINFNNTASTLNSRLGVAASSNSIVNGSAQGDLVIQNFLNNGILLATNGDNIRMAITNSGNVGIGTTSPWGQLSVNPNGITGPAFVVGSSTATKFIVTNGGNVGIGTTTPGQMLSVAGDILGNNIIGSYFTATSSTASVLRYASTTALTVSGTGYFGDGSAALPAITFADDVDTGIFSPTSGEVGISADGSYRVRFDNSSNPALTISESAANFPSTCATFQLCSAASSLVSAHFIFSAANTTGSELRLAKSRGTIASPGVITTGDDLAVLSGFGYVGASNTYQEAAQILFDSTGTISDSTTGIAGVIRFLTADTGSEPSERLTILNSGNVGIGTTTPYAKTTIWGAATGKVLEVVGSASTTFLSVAATGFGTTTLSGLTVSGSATSTSNVGFDITGGCYSINSICLSTGGASQWTTSGNDIYYNTGKIGIGTLTPMAILSVNATSTPTAIKTSSSDFSVSGSSVTSGVATTSNQITLNFATTTNIGNGTVTTGPTLSSTPGEGFHSIKRPDGKFLMIVGGSVATTMVYDPIANSTVAGPALLGNAYIGSQSVERPNGTFLITRPGTGANDIYDPVANTVSAGPASTASSGQGSHLIRRPDGKYLLINAGGFATTAIYDPVANTMITGPSLATGNASLGSHSLQRPDGKFLLINGGGTATTNIYDPVTNTFSVGPTIVGTVANTASSGSHSIQRPDGKFLVIQGGNSTNTSIYDPVANTFVAGPALASVAGAYAHSLQRPDGKFLVVNATGASPSPSNIYDPVANTFAAGPTLTSGTITLGSNSLQRPDGKYLIVHGSSGADSTLYDPGWVVSGSYESEDLNITSLNPSSILRYQTNGEGRVDVAVKTASTQANLTGATYATTTNNSLIRSATTSPQWAKVRVTLTRTIPTISQPGTPQDETNTWLGVNDTKYQRSFAQPILYSFTIENNTAFRKENADFGSGFATSTSSGNATTSGPTLSNLTGGDGGLTLPYGFDSASTTATSTTLGNYFATSTTVVGTAANTLGAGAHSIKRPDGKFLVVQAGGTTNTSIYDPATNSFVAGPALSAVAGNGSHSIKRPDGKFLIISTSVRDTSIYDPVANTIIAGPVATSTAGNPGSGSYSIKRPDGKFLLIFANLNANTSLYDPVANTFVPGPNIVGTAGNLADEGGFAIRRPDGKFLMVLGNATTNTSIYDPIANTFVAGPALLNQTGAGAHAIERPDGKFLITRGVGSGNTNIYDPVANKFTTGPTVSGTYNNGHHSLQRPDGKFLVVNAGNTTGTSLYDPVDDVISTNSTLGSLAGVGAFSIQRPDGSYLIFIGNSTASTTIYNAGWITSGFYESEYINDTTLDSTSVLSWQGNADAFKQGVVSFRVRTASSEAGLSTTTWRTIEKNGGLINPASGETWMQVRIDMQRPIPKQPNAEEDVWLSSGHTLYNRLPLQAGAGIPSVNQAEVFLKPVITSYRVFKANSPDIATFSLNGENLFRFSSAGDAFVREGGSWNSGGADVAEYFPTNDATLSAGDLVTIAQDATAGLIEKTGHSYDDNLLGIITTTPGVKLGIDIAGGTAEKQPVALVGRVPAKVSLENGAIKKGDYLTSSSRPGVAMRATDPGRVVAIALEDFSESNVDAVTGIGTVLAYVNPHTYLGTTFWDRVGSRFSRWGYLVQRSLAELGITVTDEGNVGIGTTTPVSKLSVANGNLSVYGGALCLDSTSLRCLGELTPGTLYAERISLSSQSLATYYEMKDVGTEEGDIVALSDERGTTGNKLERATVAGRVIGVVGGTDALLLGASVSSESASSSKPVISSGRVRMKVSTEAGVLKAGDRISIGSVPGVGVKASTSGMTLGIALEDFDGGLPVPLAVSTSTETGTTTQTEAAPSGGDSTTGTILVLVNLSYAKLDSDITAATQAATASSTPTNAWMVDQQGGLTSVNFFGDINLQGNRLLDVSRISGFMGKWSIDEEGNFVGESLSVKGTVKVGSPERRTGVTLYDEVTGEPYCLSLAAGAVKTMVGECPSAGVSGGASSGSASAEETPATTTPEVTTDTATSTAPTDSTAEPPATSSPDNISEPPTGEGTATDGASTTTPPTP